MIYPKDYEEKIGFSRIAELLKQLCLSQMGREEVDEMAFSQDADTINEHLEHTREFRRLLVEQENVRMDFFIDVRAALNRVKPEGTFLEESDLFDLRRSLDTIESIIRTFNINDSDDAGIRYLYPALHRLAEDVMTFPVIIKDIDAIIDKFGRMKDSASPELARIRQELAKTEGSVSRTLMSILRSAQQEGTVEKDVTPAMRDGRLVIPVAPALKRKIHGIVHDESASGKTVFIEPQEVVEANNKIRELENEERREIVRILKEITLVIRPSIGDIIDSYIFLGEVDFIQAKTKFADMIGGYEPKVKPEPYIDWIQAKHPLLLMSFEKKNREAGADEQKKVVPLDIMLTKDKRLLIISGPNAGGKSVCLKTVGLLQYMLQCGLSIPIGDRSTTGVFDSIMIDIGDEQSIDNDLSTYSSHLMNMKMMMRHASDRTLLLIDEFGTGTEPQVGGAIAESVLKQFWQKKAWGVITTHYQNLKLFAQDHKGVVNGAMLYDRHEMKALFQLAIGQPGSSFAIEIARKIGIPEEVIKDATDIVGSEYIQSDKYLQDIVRDKRYWEGKRQTVHQYEKRLADSIEKYENDVNALKKERKEILQKAKEEAKTLLDEANRRVENTIREIKEAQAEKENTRRIRQELDDFRNEVETVDQKEIDEKIAKKMAQIQARRDRQKQRKDDKGQWRMENGEWTKVKVSPKTDAEKKKDTVEKVEKDVIGVGDTVRIHGTNTVGTVESISGKNASVIFGDIKSRVKVEQLEHATKPKKSDVSSTKKTIITRQTIDTHREQFHQEIDLRGMRAEEALDKVMHFIDDAILVGVHNVRILHGKGNGILRQLIRQYLATVPNVVSFRDEHVQFGGAGITVVEL